MRHTDILDEGLVEAVASIQRSHPNSWEVMVQGHLAAQGVHIQQSRMRHTVPTVWMSQHFQNCSAWWNPSHAGGKERYRQTA